MHYSLLNKSKIKEELAVLREEYKNLFLYLLATLTGTVTSFYQVVTEKVELSILIISGIGFMVSVFLMILLKKVRAKMDKDLNELGDLK
ncbi:MAG: hypothetical protein U9N52_07375 [Campylobacterota bacterium]|nr:hypothetical protein [Campylobacterota bacterium]